MVGEGNRYVFFYSERRFEFRRIQYIRVQDIDSRLNYFSTNIFGNCRTFVKANIFDRRMEATRVEETIHAVLDCSHVVRLKVVEVDLTHSRKLF